MLAFLLIVGVSYYLVATSLIGLVGDSLFSDRMRQDHALSLIHISEPTRPYRKSRMPSSA